MKAVFAGALAVLVLASSGLQAQTASTTKADENPVVAIVNGEKIVRSEVLMFFQSLPKQYRQQPINALYPQILTAIIDRRMVAQQAVKEGLDKDEVVMRQLDFARQGILQDRYLSSAVEAKLTKERLRAVYDETIGKQTPQDEVHARHILVETEETAKKLIAEIAAGADFVETAKKNSTGPSAPRGGDLGFFAREAMVPEFAEAAFAMKPGEVSKTAVKTQFGWHIIKVEARKPGKNPSFDESADGIRQQEAQKMTMEILNTLRGAAKTERFNPDGSAIKAEAKKE